MIWKVEIYENSCGRWQWILSFKSFLWTHLIVNLFILFTIFDFVLFCTRHDSEPSKYFNLRRQTVLDNHVFEITFWLKVFKYFNFPIRHVCFESEKWMEYFKKQNIVNKKMSEVYSGYFNVIIFCTLYSLIFNVIIM